MTWTPEQLKSLEQMGATFLTVKECAIALEISIPSLEIEMKNEKSEAYKAYWKGVLNAKVKHIKSVSDLAQRGSFPAQQLIEKRIEKLD